MMSKKEIGSRLLNKTVLATVGILLLLLSAVVLLWYGNANSMQAMPALVAQVYFDGEYRIADGEWHKIVKGNHISSTEGDVTLRGNFHILAPDGEYVGIYSDNIPIALYTDHINLTFYEGENEPYVTDVENSLYGDSACHEDWIAYTLTSTSEEPIEIHIHNPHSFGNETAIDEMLSSAALWTGICHRFSYCFGNSFVLNSDTYKKQYHYLAIRQRDFVCRCILILQRGRCFVLE